MIKEIFASVLLTCNFGTPILKTPYKATNNNKIYGTYNVVNYASEELYNNESRTYVGAGYVFDDTFSNEDLEAPKYLNPVWYNSKEYFLEYMHLEWYKNQFFSIEIGLYDLYLNATTIEYEYYMGDYSSDLDVKDASMYFQIRQSYLMTQDQALLFNSIFTTQDNYFVTTYTGYYSFNNSLTVFNSTANMQGLITIGQRMYTGARTVTGTSSNSGLRVEYYDSQNNNYTSTVLKLPFSATGNSNQWYLTGVKMTQEEYATWTTYGTFAYIPRTTPDAYDFNDLFFSMADTPIYFIYSIFNWQLMGANLFIAFVGLISFAIILVLFRRFMM